MDVSATDAGSGVKQIVLANAGGIVKQQSFDGTTDPAVASFTGLSDGVYTVTAIDFADNESAPLTFIIDTAPPKIRVIDDAFADVSNDGGSSSGHFSVGGTDFAKDGVQHGSGIKKISLVALTGGTYSEERSFAGFPFSESVEFPFSGALNEATYRATVTDAADNSTSLVFTVDTTPPAVVLLDQRGKALISDSAGAKYLSKFTAVSVTGDDAATGGVPGSGIASVSITGITEGASFPTPAVYPQPKGQTAAQPVKDLANGDYAVVVKDLAGNQTTTFLNVNAVGPIVTLSGNFYSGSSWEYDPFRNADPEIANTAANQLEFRLDASVGARSNDLAPAPLRSFVLSYNGSVVLSKDYSTNDPPTTADVVAYPSSLVSQTGEPLMASDGVYTFAATNSEGEVTSGTIVHYTFKVSVDLGKSVATFNPLTSDFDSLPTFVITNTGPNPTKLLRISSTALSRTISNPGDTVTLTAPLGSGLYQAVAEDVDGEATQSFALEFNQGAITDIFDGAALDNTAFDSNQQVGNPVVHLDFDRSNLVSYTDPNGALFRFYLFQPSGSVTSKTLDLKASSSTALSIPPNTIGAAIAFHQADPAQNSFIDLGLDVVESGMTGLPEVGNVDSGMSLTWAVATGDQANQLGTPQFVASRNIVLDAGPDGSVHGFHPNDRFSVAPIPLKRFVQVKETLTRSSVVVRESPPGGASPEVYNIGWRPTLLTMRVFQGAGEIFEVGSADGLLVFRAPVGGLTVDDPPTLVANVPGVSPASRQKRVDPPVVAFGTQGTVVMKFSTETVASAGIDPATLALYQAEPGRPFSRVPLQSLDLSSRVITGYISQVQLDTVFQIFGTTRSYSLTNGPGEAVVTRSSLDSLSVSWDANGNSPYASYQAFYATVPASAANCDDSAASFVIVPVVGNAIQLSGLNADQRYLVYVCNPNDSGDDSCDGLVQGATTASGSIENPSFIRCVQSGPTKQLALGSGTDGRLWEVSADGQGSVTMGLFSVQGNPISSAAIPSAASLTNWSVAFDPSGNTYAVGSVFGQATDAAVAKFAPNGSLISVATLDGGSGLNDLVLGAAVTSGGLWITGVRQTGGALDLSSGLTAEAALWRYDFNSGLLTLTTSYAGPARLDLGLAVAAAPDGGAWVVGLSSRPDTNGSAKLAQALWRFDAQGLLAGGPSLVPGFLAGLDKLGAGITVSSSVVSSVMQRLNRAGNTDLGFTRFSALDGGVLGQSGWHGLPGASEFVSRTALSPAGSIFVAGGAGSGDQDSLALWSFTPDGVLIAAQTALINRAAVTPAAGISFANNALWLAAGTTGAPFKFTASTPLSGSVGFEGGAVDVLAPRTALFGPIYGVGPSSGTLFLSPQSFYRLTSYDDAAVNGDGLGSGVVQTLVRVDAEAFTGYSSTRSLSGSGTHVLSFYSVDAAGNTEAVKTSTIAVDSTPPLVSLIAAGTNYSLVAQDPATSGPASGVAQINYVVDPPANCAGGHDPSFPPGTCANITYGGSFGLSIGTHTVLLQAIDAVGNGKDVLISSFVVVSGANSGFTPFALNPSTGPIGIPFAIAGSGFGSYNGGNTRVLIGGATAPLSVWNDTTINGTIPGLSTGVYAATIAIGTASYGAGNFTVLLPTATSISVSSGPIGQPFSISGAQFGPYAGTLTRVLIGGATAPLSVWNDAQIAGAVPNLSTGTYTVQVQRATGDGGLMTITPFSFQVVGPSPTGLTPSSGPIGVPFTVTGSGFGPYAGSQTTLLFDGKAAPLSVWNDAQITGTVPNLSSGMHFVWIQRQSSDGGLITSASGQFLVTVPAISTVVPTSGPIGNGFTLTGTAFGPYAGSFTQALMGGATVALSVWNDTMITGTVPGSLLPGTYPLFMERLTADGGLVTSNTVYFQVTAPFGASLSVSSGPIGVPFTITGTGFGAYGGPNTIVQVGGVSAPLSVWNDTTISGTIPKLSTGSYGVVVERISGANISSAAVGAFAVLPLSPTGFSPSSGSIGVPFAITGTAFGPYAGSLTRVLFDGAAAPLSVWNDTHINGTVPALSTGTHAVWIERASSDGGLESSDTAYFTVVLPAIASITPSSGPIGVSFTLAGSGFGPYDGANTQVLLGGATIPLSVWNDAVITGAVPGGTPTGPQSVVVRRAAQGVFVYSSSVTFQVTGMTLAALSPSTGPIGIPFTITGGPFGAYGGSNTRVKFGATAASLSVWNDTTISGSVPALAIGTCAVTVERQQGTTVSVSNSAVFDVIDYSLTGLSPTSGPIGTPFTVTGSGFGPYAGSNTRLMVAGVAASLSVWNDSQISGTIPALSSGTVPMWIERQSGTAVQSSATGYFTITVPSVASLVSSSAPIGAPFTITGTSFGPYAGSNTKVLIGGVSAPLSVWNDTTISGTVPGALSTGTTGLVVSITAGASTVQTSTLTFTVLLPTIQTMDPTFGAAGTGVQLTGLGFGPYGGSQTKVLLGTTSVSLSVWNDQRIVWTVPTGVPDGTYPVVVTRTPSGGTVTSSSMTFTVGSGSGGLSLVARSAAPLAAEPDWHFEGGLFLSTETGGKIASPSHAAVTVPAGALSTATVVTMSRDRSTSVASRTAALSDAKLGAAGEAISFGPEGTHFAVPVTLELPYDPSLVPDGKLGELAIHYYDPVAKTWSPLSTTADPIRHVLTAQTNHFSLYQPLGHGVGVLAANAAFGLNAAYAFPNPVHSGAVTIRMQPGLADSVSVRIYDLSGRKVHESSDFTVNPSFDDGNGLGPQYTYDHFWDISGVGSGVYTFALTAKKSGQADIHKTGKIGVAK